MASGTITGSTGNENIDAKIEWSSEVVANTRTSKVTATLYYRRNNTGYTTSGTGDFAIKIDGTETKISKYINIGTGWVGVVTATKTVTHNANGRLAITISASGSISGTTLTSTNVSGEASLDSIRVAANVNSFTCSTNYLTGTLTFNYTVPYPGLNLYHQAWIWFRNRTENQWQELETKVNLGKLGSTGSHTGTVSLSAADLSKIYKGNTTSTSVPIQIYIAAFTTNAYTVPSVSRSEYSELDLQIPNDSTTKPTMTMTLSHVTDTPGLSVYAKGLSKVKANFSNGAGKYGATIISYKMTVAGKDYASPYTSDLLSTTGTITVKGTITDSRGFSNTYSQNITVYDYTSPTLDSVACKPTYFDGTMTFKYRPANSVFYSRCVIALNISGTYTQIREIRLGQKAASQQTETVTLNESELSTIYTKLPSSTSGTLSFTFRTYTDSGYSNQIGTTDYKEITLSIPDIDATKPTATLTITPVSSLSSTFSSFYIKGKTKVKADLTNRAAKYGSSIKSYSVTIGAQSGTPPLTSAYIAAAGNLTVKGTVTDTRGFSRTYTQNITVIDHSAPLLIPASGQSSVIAARCNSAGALDENGTYLKIAVKRSYSRVMVSGTQKNYCKIQYRYKKDGGSYNSWTELLSRTASSDEVVTGALLGGALSATSTYIVQIMAVDDIGDSTTTTITISTQKVYMHKAGSRNSLGFGKYVEETNTVDVDSSITVKVRGKFLVGDEASAAALEDDIPSLPVEISDTGWISLGLSDKVSASSSDIGRGPDNTGCYYRVINGRHVYVAFNCAFTYANTTLQVNLNAILQEYRPVRTVCTICAIGGRAVARILINNSGNIVVDWIQSIQSGVSTESGTVSWIDGYIDYWI